MRHLRIGLLVIGVAFLVALIVKNDPRMLLASMRALSWRLALVVCFPSVVVAIFDTLGWRFAFAGAPAPFGLLVAARLAGEAFNLTTPTGAVGGELIKAWLIRPRVTLKAGVPSVIVAKTSIAIAQGLFLLVGILLASRLDVPTSLLLAMESLLIAEVLALGIFVIAQTRQLFARGQRILRAVGVPGSPRLDALAGLDEALAGFYRMRRGRLALSVTFHFLAWLLGAIESYLILYFLGLPVPLLFATVIEAFGASIRFATFLVPASVGVLEGSYAAMFAALGLGSPAGLAFTLVRRVREMVWIALGLIIFATMRTTIGGAATGSMARG